MDKKVKIYTTPTCTFCKQTKEFLKEQNVNFEEADVSTDEAARDEMVKKSGQMGVPVIDIDGELVIGFNKEKLASLLGLS